MFFMNLDKFTFFKYQLSAKILQLFFEPKYSSNLQKFVNFTKFYAIEDYLTMNFCKVWRIIPNPVHK